MTKPIGNVINKNTIEIKKSKSEYKKKPETSATMFLSLSKNNPIDPQKK